MTDRKLTDNEIIKALEYWKEFDKEIDDMLKTCSKHDKLLVEQKEMVQITFGVFDLFNRLQAKVEEQQKIIDSFTDIGKLYSEIKAEAYKECIEKIQNQIKNNNAISAEWLREYLYNLLKEKVGNSNES